MGSRRISALVRGVAVMLCGLGRAKVRWVLLGRGRVRGGRESEEEDEGGSGSSWARCGRECW